MASPYEKGRSIYFQHGCANCHGTQAEGSGIYPKLALKRKILIINRLDDFKNGKATSQTAEMMFSFANELSKKDIENVSIFLSNFKKNTSTKYEVSDDILGSVD